MENEQFIDTTEKWVPEHQTTDKLYVYYIKKVDALTDEVNVEIVYSLSFPIYKKDLIQIKRPFHKKEMTENILNEGELIQEYKVDYDSKEYIIPIQLVKSIFIEIQETEDWVYLNESQAKEKFEKAKVEMLLNINNKFNQ